jgi:hypothetical protein
VFGTAILARDLQWKHLSEQGRERVGVRLGERRQVPDQAAFAASEFPGLKDGLKSCRRFVGRALPPPASPLSGL